MFWNGRISLDKVPLFFLREYEFDDYSSTKRLKALLQLDLEKTWFMLNVSVVNLGLLSRQPKFKERALELFNLIVNISNDPFLGDKDVTQLHRTSEKLAMSIAGQELGDFRYLKDSDYVMDGGIAESFYLGATKGF
jgi:hypothetical protein